MGRFGSWCQKHPKEAARYLRVVSKNVYASSVLSGKDARGSRLAGPGHTHYWPTMSEWDPRKVDSVTLFAREGFAPAEVAALASMQRLKVGGLELRVQLIGVGQVDSLGEKLVGPSSVWQSVTPFLGNSEIGMRARSRFLRKGLRREWRRLAEQVSMFHGVELLEVEELSADMVRKAGLPQPHEYRRARSKRGAWEAYRPAAMFRLYFSKPISGPFSLGYGSHFGMGLFRPQVER
jgi:CRISPR-associated protein Csb2